MTRPEYYAHSSNHRLSAHLENTGERAAAFLESTGCADFGRVAGLLHDLGKYTQEFQDRLSGGKRVDHSTAGAKVAVDRFGKLAGKILAFCIAGHHAGLANGVNGRKKTGLADRLKATVPTPDKIWEKEIVLPESLPNPGIKPYNRNTAGFCGAFFIRMVFSALVDADYLDTEAWYAKQEGKRKPRGQHPTLDDLRRRLDAYLSRLTAGAKGGKVNDLRREVLDHARSKAAEAPGVFTLTVPTGGGKTLTSLAFALDHAMRHKLARVIYVIPYMSIIEQTAEVFRKALWGNDDDEPDFVIEHHSTFDEDQIGSREAKDKLRLAMENWDAPIIVTTAVQFFESLFADRPSRCRKLHNIANSVVILDEAQTLPLEFLRPCVTALDELARNWHASIVLCTATQPALAAADGFSGGFEDMRELAPDPQRLYRTLKRTRLDHRGEMSDIQVEEQLRKAPQALCIVNTRRHAWELYEAIKNVEGAFHLTTRMCACHRRKKLHVVRERLKSGAPVRLIATSLIEAGVDIDFPVVWRAESGLESIIQAAGRCNREGRADMGDVFVFKPTMGTGRKPPQEIEQFASAAREVMRDHDDSMSLEAIEDYFQKLYWVKGKDALDAQHVLGLIEERRTSFDFPFETIAEKFRLIKTSMVPVIIPYRDQDGGDETAVRLLSELERVERPGPIARGLQPYLVQIYSNQRTDLLTAGAAKVVREADFDKQFVVLTNLDLYRSDVGLTWDDPTFREPEGLLF